MRQPVSRPTEVVVEPTTSFAQIYERIPPPGPPVSDAVIVLPSMTIVGTALADVRKPVREPQCGAWWPLQQGSNMVQMCE